MTSDKPGLDQTRVSSNGSQHNLATCQYDSDSHSALFPPSSIPPSSSSSSSNARNLMRILAHSDLQALNPHLSSSIQPQSNSIETPLSLNPPPSSNSNSSLHSRPNEIAGNKKVEGLKDEEKAVLSSNQQIGQVVGEGEGGNDQDQTYVLVKFESLKLIEKIMEKLNQEEVEGNGTSLGLNGDTSAGQSSDKGKGREVDSTFDLHDGSDRFNHSPTLENGRVEDNLGDSSLDMMSESNRSSTSNEKVTEASVSKAESEIQDQLAIEVSNFPRSLSTSSSRPVPSSTSHLTSTSNLHPIAIDKDSLHPTSQVNSSISSSTSTPIIRPLSRNKSQDLAENEASTEDSTEPETETVYYHLSVQNLPLQMTSAILLSAFSFIPSLKSAHVYDNKTTFGMVKSDNRFGFVSFQDLKDAERALELNGELIGGRRMKVEWSFKDKSSALVKGNGRKDGMYAPLTSKQGQSSSKARAKNSRSRKGRKEIDWADEDEDIGNEADQVELDFSKEEDWPSLASTSVDSIGSIKEVHEIIESSKENESITFSHLTPSIAQPVDTSITSLPPSQIIPTFLSRRRIHSGATSGGVKLGGLNSKDLRVKVLSENEKDSSKSNTSQSSPSGSTYGQSGPHVEALVSPNEINYEGEYPPPMETMVNSSGKAQLSPDPTSLNSTIFVGNLSVNSLIPIDRFLDLFKKFGVIQKYRINAYPDSEVSLESRNTVLAVGSNGNQEGFKDPWSLNVSQMRALASRHTSAFGFVEMKDHQAARRAIESLNGTGFSGRNLRLGWARPLDRSRGSYTASRVGPSNSDVPRAILKRNPSHYAVISATHSLPNVEHRPSQSGSGSSDSNFRFPQKMSNGYPPPYAYEPKSHIESNGARDERPTQSQAPERSPEAKEKSSYWASKLNGQKGYSNRANQASHQTSHPTSGKKNYQTQNDGNQSQSSTPRAPDSAGPPLQPQGFENAQPQVIYHYHYQHQQPHQTQPMPMQMQMPDPRGYPVENQYHFNSYVAPTFYPTFPVQSHPSQPSQMIPPFVPVAYNAPPLQGMVSSESSPQIHPHVQASQVIPSAFPHPTPMQTEPALAFQNPSTAQQAYPSLGISHMEASRFKDQRGEGKVSQQAQQTDPHLCGCMPPNTSQNGAQVNSNQTYTHNQQVEVSSTFLGKSPAPSKEWNSENRVPNQNYGNEPHLAQATPAGILQPPPPMTAFGQRGMEQTPSQSEQMPPFQPSSNQIQVPQPLHFQPHLRPEWEYQGNGEGLIGFHGGIGSGETWGGRPFLREMGAASPFEQERLTARVWNGNDKTDLQLPFRFSILSDASVSHSSVDYGTGSHHPTPSLQSSAMSPSTSIMSSSAGTPTGPPSPTAFFAPSALPTFPHINSQVQEFKSHANENLSLPSNLHLDQNSMFPVPHANPFNEGQPRPNFSSPVAVPSALAAVATQTYLPTTTQNFRSSHQK